MHDSSNCYHGRVGVSLTEQRLRRFGKEGGFLTRESNIQPGFYILSVFVKGEVIHRVAPNKDGLIKKQSFEEATLVLSELILAKEDCSVPLSPGFCSGYSDPVEIGSSRCKACSYSNENKKKLQDHERTHYIRQCTKCHLFVRKGSFVYHKKQCEATSAPVKHLCGIEDCKFATYHESSIHRHRRSHQGSLKCGSCTRFFKTKEKLESHKLHSHSDDPSYSCQHCSKKFKTSSNRAKHVRAVHLMSVRRHSIGWARWEDNLQKKKKGRTIFPCREENCKFKTHNKRALDKHIAHKHPKEPPIKKEIKCDGCGFKTTWKSRMMKHVKTCVQFIGNTMRFVPTVSNKTMKKVAMKHNISLNMFKAMMRDFQKENPNILFEKGLDAALKESIEALSEWYSTERINVVNSKGNEKLTAAVVVKELNDLIQKIIEKNDIKDPLVTFGLDGGQGKFLITMHVYDRSDLTRDYAGFSQGGRRRSLVIGVADGCSENRDNLDTLLKMIKIEDIPFPRIQFILCSDLKCANILFAIGAHSSMCPCYICEGHKIDDDTGLRVTNKRVREWLVGIPRTPNQINKRHEAHTNKWSGKKRSKTREKADIKNHGSVIGRCIPLPEAMMNMLTLFILPPDPLHLFLGMGNDLVESLFTEAEAKKEPGQDLSYMDKFVQQPGLGLKPQRTMIGGQYNGPELRLVLQAAADGKLPEEIEDREVIAAYCAAILDFYGLCVAKQLDPNYKARIQNFRDKFFAVYDLKVFGEKRDLVAATVKVHIAFSHVEEYMDATGQSLYTADCSSTESTHGAFAKTQQRHGFQVTHNFGTESHEARLLSTVKFHNARNDFITNEVAEPPVLVPDPGVVMASTLTGDSTPATQEAALYKTRCQELEHQIEEQQKIISDYEAAKVNSDLAIADLSAKLNIQEQVLIFYTRHNLILI